MENIKMTNDEQTTPIDETPHTAISLSDEVTRAVDELKDRLFEKVNNWANQIQANTDHVNALSSMFVEHATDMAQTVQHLSNTVISNASHVSAIADTVNQMSGTTDLKPNTNRNEWPVEVLQHVNKAATDITQVVSDAAETAADFPKNIADLPADLTAIPHIIAHLHTLSNDIAELWAHIKGK